MKKAHTSNQKRISTPIAIGFFAIIAIFWVGSRLYSNYSLANEHFAPVTPGKANIVGIDASAGFQILVANRMAQLVEASGSFDSHDSGSGGATEGAIKKRVPVKEMLEVLQGDPKAVGPFVMNLNEMNEDETWPTVRVLWTAEDLQKAFAGDAALTHKLEQDLNMHLDGTPLPTVRIASLQNGIVLDYPVSIPVTIDGVVKSVTGRVQQPYRPRMVQLVEADCKDKVLTTSMILGYYGDEGQKVLHGTGPKEDIKKQILDRLSKSNADRLIELPKRVLDSATVVVNEKYITKASHRTYDTTRGTMYDLTIDLTDEGRRRLWKYSQNRVNSHLLLVTDGIPIAAPIIREELSEGELTITQMEDEALVKDAEDMLNHDSTQVAAR